jgi:hypothetical protein
MIPLQVRLWQNPVPAESGARRRRDRHHARLSGRRRVELAPSEFPACRTSDIQVCTVCTDPLSMRVCERLKMIPLIPV